MWFINYFVHNCIGNLLLGNTHSHPDTANIATVGRIAAIGTVTMDHTIDIHPILGNLQCSFHLNLRTTIGRTIDIDLDNKHLPNIDIVVWRD